jgi:hypothetical protein
VLAAAQPALGQSVHKRIGTKVIRWRSKRPKSGILGGALDGRSSTAQAGIVGRRLGRPGAEPKQIARARHELAKGLGIGKVARMTGLGTGLSTSSNAKWPPNRSPDTTTRVRLTPIKLPQILQRRILLRRAKCRHRDRPLKQKAPDDTGALNFVRSF